MSLEIRLIDEFVALDLEVDSGVEALKFIAGLGENLNLVRPTWLAAVTRREIEFPTGLPTLIPVAIPHTDSVHVIADGVGFFKLVNPVDFGEMGSLDAKIQVQMILPLLITNPAEQVELLMAVIGALQKSDFLEALAASGTKEEVIAIFRAEGL